MIFNRKVEIIFSNEDKHILDGQSKICNWLYNKLLEIAIYDYDENKNNNNLLAGRNLRNLVPKLKSEYSFLTAVHSSPLKNTAIRLKKSYIKFFNKDNSFPHYRSWKENWFSLFYDEPNKGFKLLEGNKLKISLGVNESKSRLTVIGHLKEKLSLRKEDNIKNFRLCSQQGGRYYAIFCIEREDIKVKKGDRLLSIDPNHKNLFMAVDNNGVAMNLQSLVR